MTVTYETKLYCSIGEFKSPMSYEETMKKVEEGNGVLILERWAISNRVIRNEKGEQTQVDANTKITVRLDTIKCPVLCYEEFEMHDCIRDEKTNKNIIINTNKYCQSRTTKIEHSQYRIDIYG